MKSLTDFVSFFHKSYWIHCRWVEKIRFSPTMVCHHSVAKRLMKSKNFNLNRFSQAPFRFIIICFCNLKYKHPLNEWQMCFPTKFCSICWQTNDGKSIHNMNTQRVIVYSMDHQLNNVELAVSCSFRYSSYNQSIFTIDAMKIFILSLPQNHTVHDSIFSNMYYLLSFNAVCSL